MFSQLSAHFNCGAVWCLRVVLDGNYDSWIVIIDVASSLYVGTENMVTDDLKKKNLPDFCVGDAQRNIHIASTNLIASVSSRRNGDTFC